MDGNGRDVFEVVVVLIEELEKLDRLFLISCILEKHPGLFVDLHARLLAAGPDGL
jgi:hypothetical protein